MKAELLWVTPDAFNVVAQCARVSNPANEKNFETAPRLLRYLVKHHHYSPLEMANACVYIECPRDISRQILRHRSFSFQEFSGRYATYFSLGTRREFRLRDRTNRQNSLQDRSVVRRIGFYGLQQILSGLCHVSYRAALACEAAPEVARVLLPEGLVPTRMYVNGTLRSWYHYIKVRTTPETQKEHREVAEECKRVLCSAIPQFQELLDMENGVGIPSPT